MAQDHDTIYTQRHLAKAFSRLGVMQGQTVMLHASIKAVGNIMGGPNVILQALQEVLGSNGTLMMYAGWEDIPDFVLDLPPALRQLYYEEHPPFDPAISRSYRENGVLAEFLRTFPGTVRSQNPEASMLALGKHAVRITENHALNYGYGLNSPLARLVELKGKVLMLGAPLDTVTLLHHAENLAKMRHKKVIRYQCPILIDGEKTWVDIEDYDTGEEHDDYSFAEIVRAYLSANQGQQGPVGDARSYLFDAAQLTSFAVNWLEERFGPGK